MGKILMEIVMHICHRVPSLAKCKEVIKAQRANEPLLLWGWVHAQDEGLVIIICCPNSPCVIPTTINLPTEDLPALQRFQTPIILLLYYLLKPPHGFVLLSNGRLLVNRIFMLDL